MEELIYLIVKLIVKLAEGSSKPLPKRNTGGPIIVPGSVATPRPMTTVAGARRLTAATARKPGVARRMFQSLRRPTPPSRPTAPVAPSPPQQVTLRAPESQAPELRQVTTSASGQGGLFAPSSLRTRFVLSEILRPPLALREPLD